MEGTGTTQQVPSAAASTHADCHWGSSPSTASTTAIEEGSRTERSGAESMEVASKWSLPKIDDGAGARKELLAEQNGMCACGARPQRRDTPGLRRHASTFPTPSHAGQPVISHGLLIKACCLLKNRFFEKQLKSSLGLFSVFSLL
jgi:hypothetical protein